MKNFILFVLAALLPVTASAALKFDYHSDSSTQAYYATGWRDMTKIESATTAITLTTGPAGTFGTTYLDMSSVTNNDNYIAWTGQDNAPLGTSGVTFLFRLIPVASGAPVANAGVFSVGSVKDGNQGGIGGYSFGIDTLGKLHVTAGQSNTTGLNYFNFATCASALTFVANQPLDIWWVWDGTTTSGHASIWTAQNGGTASQLCTMTASNALTAGSRVAAASLITEDLADLFQNKNQFHINEVAIWDDAETPSSYGSRTNFVYTGTAFEGYNHTSLSAGNVRSGSVYGPGPGTLTGTLVAPSLANTKIGVSGDGGTGTYDGSDRWTCPIAGNLLDSASALKCNSTSTNLSGTYSAANIVAAAVKHGVTFGVSGGSAGSYFGADYCTDPGANSVLSTATYISAGSSIPGNYVIPTTFQVENGVAYGVAGGSTGRLVCTQLATNDVVSGVAYTNYAGDFIGNYTPGGTIPPGNQNVRAGTIYALDGVGQIGTMIIPPVGKVQVGYAYDDGFTLGTLVCTDLSPSVVASGQAYTTYTGNHTGTLAFITNILSTARMNSKRIIITQGDVISVRLTALDGNGRPMNITGATFQTQINGPSGTPVTLANGVHSVIDAPGGVFQINIDAATSASFRVGDGLEIVTKITQGSNITYFHGVGLLQVLQASPSQ